MKHKKKEKLPYHKYELYEASVQDPKDEMEFVNRVYQEVFQKDATHLREDFCATFRNSCHWVKRGPKHRAVAVDLCEKTINYGKKHTDFLTKDEIQRIRTYVSNVMTVKTPSVDVISVSNFSIGYIKKRNNLVKYFKNNLTHLRNDGIMIFDLLGGQEISEPVKEKRTFSMPDGTRVQYIWDHEEFNPINRNASYSIHYKLKGKPAFERVFEYHWRMWSIPEVVDCLIEAGFDDVKVYWEEDDEDGEGNGYFSQSEKVEDCPIWIAYVVGVKK